MRRQLFLLVLLTLFACDGRTDSQATSIPVIQGSTDRSPLEGETVTFAGIVTGDFQDNDGNAENDLGGFYVQSETPDEAPDTSEGIFVYDGNSPDVDVAVGDHVEVRGTVKEHFGETQIVSPHVRVKGSGHIEATAISLPATGLVTNSDGQEVADLERYEGMLLSFPQPLTVTNLRNLGRFGTVTLSAGGRLIQFTNGNAPDPAGYRAHRQSGARRSIVLDDGRRSENDADVRYIDAAASRGQSLRIGDTVTGLTGNLRYSRGSGGNGDENWRLMPVADPEFSADNPRPGAPTAAGALRVASFNVLNFFSTIDDGSAICGPARDQACRGADNVTELERQSARTAAALALMDADIVGITELENNPRASLDLLVETLNAKLGTQAYAWVDTGTIGDDAIKVGLIYRRSAVAPTGDFALLDDGVDARFDAGRNRPVLAQTFRITGTSDVLTVAIAHLKSKGSGCEDISDLNTGDGQGNCNRTRTQAAAATATWLLADPTASGSTDFLLVGDMNAYAREDPIQALEQAGLVNLLGKVRDPYSFLFDSQSGALDHAFASPALAPRIVDAVEWHINADEPPLLDYNLEFGRNPDLFDPDSPYRASDHDPVVVDLLLKR